MQRGIRHDRIGGMQGHGCIGMKVGSNQGFTLVELVIVIAVLGLIAVYAVPHYSNLTRNARLAVLDGIAASMRSAADMTKMKARASGLRPASSNPAGSGGNQYGYVVQFPFGSAEVDWRNLCPESKAELGNRLTMIDFLDFYDADLQTRIDNQYTLIGYQLPASGVPTNQGCYVIYDSFGDPNCTVTVVDVDC